MKFDELDLRMRMFADAELPLRGDYTRYDESLLAGE